MTYRLSHLAVLLLPVLLAVLLSGWAQSKRSLSLSVPAVQAHYFAGSDALQAFFRKLEYPWPLSSEVTVPRLVIDPLPADLPDLKNAQRRKALFVRSLLPLIMLENTRIETRRVRLQALHGQVRGQEAKWLLSLAEEYGVSTQQDLSLVHTALLGRVDTVPVALVMAQAAKESGWGSSRFAREGNNLFGQWTFNADQGLMPMQRDADRQHYVRRFRSLRQSVRSYLHNINTNRAYRELRAMRTDMRRHGRVPDALKLAEGLARYSERGAVYVTEIQQLIRSNGFALLDSLVFRKAA